MIFKYCCLWFGYRKPRIRGIIAEWIAVFSQDLSNFDIYIYLLEIMRNYSYKLN